MSGSKPTGYTAQYLSLAWALRVQLNDYFARGDTIGQHIAIENSGELDARRLTIVLLTASLCESCINTALALALDPKEFKTIERKPTLKKWFIYSRRVNSGFSLTDTSPDGQELNFIFECRNATTHAQPQVHTETNSIHTGNHAPWLELHHDRILRIVRVPVSLVRQLCDGMEPLIAAMPTSLEWELQLQRFSKYEKPRGRA